MGPNSNNVYESILLTIRAILIELKLTSQKYEYIFVWYYRISVLQYIFQEKRWWYEFFTLKYFTTLIWRYLVSNIKICNWYKSPNDTSKYIKNMILCFKCIKFHNFQTMSNVTIVRMNDWRIKQVQFNAIFVQHICININLSVFKTCFKL